MCTFLILRHVHPEWPLVLGANRDERYDRASSGTEVLSLSPRIIGGRDLERQGTWMGVTDTGFFVGLTNQRASAALARGARSRGEVVLRTLEAGGVEEAERYLSGLDARDYLAFNLLFGTAETLKVAYGRPTAERLQVEEVPSGVHVLSNDVLDSPALPKVPRARALAERIAHTPWPQTVRHLEALLSDHELPHEPLVLLPHEASRPDIVERARELQALCIHTPGYGTRSSALFALAPGRVAEYLAAEGPPCRTAWRDMMPLLYPARQSVA